MKSSGKLMIIDDDQRNIFALSAILQSYSYDCIGIGHAREGIEMLLSNPDIKLVLLDMMMPDMDGYETLMEIRSSGQLHQLPVIALTAQAMPGDRDKCIQAGANEYISKPVDVDQLLKILKKYIK